MTSERIQRRVDRLLNQAEEAADRKDWPASAELAREALALDATNGDAQALLASAIEMLGPAAEAAPTAGPPQPRALASVPDSFVNGRYGVRRFLGEGGKKKVYLAHDTLLDRDVAFALIKTEGLDEVGKERITREAQAMGRLGDHPNIVTVYDIGTEPMPGGSAPGIASTQPYLVLPLLPGGDIEGLIEKAPEHRLPIEQVLKLGIETCQGLEFAHAKGIVHRDLKPGNVWLDEAGRAKIGDFGLAVAVDRSRLTQAGMMVGTVSYMPPEQAMGGEVTARSDLYSLGAMLYEMVCGRPPFVGDESVAIIGQHLNTPPVAPAWHRPDCPAGLESLILRLLEKDPSKRPGSASAVREALTSLTLTLSLPGRGDQSSGSASEANPGPLPNQGEGGRRPGEGDPLYRGAFVGREQELRQLRDAFDATMSGRGSLAMVVGEPGIGKTALCEQLATYVAMRGGRALVGHCYEEGSLSLPYLAFIEALRTYVLAREPDGLRSDLGSAGPEVARIVSEIRDRADVQPSAASGDPEDDRWRLLQAVTSFLRNASSVQPLLIVLEDLHWADRGTLDLLLHVARNLQGARLLVIGTYRDVEVDRAHALSSTLAELRRAGPLPRVLLRGLTVEEVQRMYNFIRGQDVTWAQAEAVHRQTEGNPLFVQEVIRYLVEEGYVVREAGRWVLAEGTVPGTGIPDGLRDVVGKRLNRLSEKTNRVLSIAAVMGREFRVDVLQQVSGLSEEEVISALEEANERAVVEQRQVLGAIAFRFTHAFFRSTLYEEMFAPRRIRLHQQVGRALEQAYARRLDEHAAELAEHFAQSTEREDLEKALHYCELAAQRAMSVFAYGEAERHLQQALRALEVLDPDDKAKRCDLLLALGDAMLPQENPGRVAENAARDAFSVAASVGDKNRQALASLQALDGLIRAGPAAAANPEGRAWVENLAQSARPGTSDEIYVEFYKGLTVGGGPLLFHPHIRKAAELAVNTTDKGAFFAAATRGLGNLRALRDQNLRDGVLEEALKRSHDGVPNRTLGAYLAHAGRSVLERGDRSAAERMWQELAVLADRTRDSSNRMQATMPPVVWSFLDGDFYQTLRLLDDAEAAALELGVTGVAAVAAASIAIRSRTHNYLGSLSESILVGIKGLGQLARPAESARALTLAYLGRYDETESIRVQFGDIASDADESAAAILVAFLEAAIIARDIETAVQLSRRLMPLAGRLAEVSIGVGVEVSYGRLLGASAMLGGWPTEARNYYEQALEVCEKVRFRPEIALIRLDLAELLLDHYPDERDTAIEHLDFAIAEFREMKMQPSLERALRHRGLLKA